MQLRAASWRAGRVRSSSRDKTETSPPSPAACTSRPAGRHGRAHGGRRTGKGAPPFCPALGHSGCHLRTPGLHSSDVTKAEGSTRLPVLSLSLKECVCRETETERGGTPQRARVRAPPRPARLVEPSYASMSQADEWDLSRGPHVGSSFSRMWPGAGAGTPGQLGGTSAMHVCSPLRHLTGWSPARGQGFVV